MYRSRELPHPEDNRSPLYPILIALAGVTGFDLLRCGQTVNLLGFLLLLLLFAHELNRRYGRAASLGGMVFLSASPLFITFTSEIYADLIIACGYFAFLFYPGIYCGTWKKAILGGLLAGCLYLLKMTAVFILPACLVGIFLTRKENRLWLRQAIVLTLVFSAVIAPWCIRNYIEFGSPVYHFARFFIYADTHDYMFTVGALKPSLASALAQHGSWWVFFGRPFMGIFAFLKNFAEFDHSLSIALIPLAVIGLTNIARSKGLSRSNYPLIVFLALYTPAMMNGAYSMWVYRFCMIYYILLYYLAAVGIAASGQLFRQKMPRAELPVAALLIILPLFTVIWPMEYYLSKRGNESEYDKIAQSSIKRLYPLLTPNATVFSNIVSSYCYRYPIRCINPIVFPTVTAMEGMFASYNVTLALFDTAWSEEQQRMMHCLPGYAVERIRADGPIVLSKITRTNHSFKQLPTD